MDKDLTNSPVERQNILNNPFALAEIEKAAGVRGIPFAGKTVVLKDQVASFLEVSVRTIENNLEQYSDELARNGYVVLKGNRLQSFKLAIQDLDVPETDFGNILKTPHDAAEHHASPDSSLPGMRDRRGRNMKGFLTCSRG